MSYTLWIYTYFDGWHRRGTATTEDVRFISDFLRQYYIPFFIEWHE